MRARLFDKKSSAYEDVNIEFKKETLYVHTHDKTLEYKVDDISFSDRLGNMPRSLYLSDAKVCEIQDNDAVDAYLKINGKDKASALVHHFESKSIYIIPALLITLSVLFLFMQFVLPYSAKKIAYAVPQNVASQIGTGTLEALDKLVLKPSKLDKEKKQEIQSAFLKMSLHMSGLPPLDLQFRSAKEIGPNAFALPDGTIIMTDQLVLLADNNEELLSVLAHEIGHIKNRHAIRMVLQNSAMIVLITTITGDATTASSVVSTLPTILIESSFSRDLESEADDYAMDVMRNSGLELHYFADIMEKLSMGRDEEKSGEYFSSHPMTSSRITKFRTAQ